MKKFEALYTKIYNESLNLLKEDFNIEKAEWRDNGLIYGYRNEALNMPFQYPEEVKTILFKAEVLFLKRKKLSSIVYAVLEIVESKDDEEKTRIVETIAKVKAEKDFITYLDNYIAESEKAPRRDIKSANSKVKRSKDDGLTKLNQIQTAIFFKYLRDSKIILAEDYLPNTILSDLINITTGFSNKQIRQSLSVKKKEYRKEDLIEILNISELINSQIKRDLNNNQ